MRNLLYSRDKVYVGVVFEDVFGDGYFLDNFEGLRDWCVNFKIFRWKDRIVGY